MMGHTITADSQRSSKWYVLSNGPIQLGACESTKIASPLCDTHETLSSRRVIPTVSQPKCAYLLRDDLGLTLNDKGNPFAGSGAMVSN